MAIGSDRAAARALGVAIVDDEPLARRGVRRLVAAQPGFRVVGEAETGSEAGELIARARPDVVLLDVQMPDGSGLDAIRRVPPDDRPVTIFVSAFDYAVDAFGVRAVDYVLKPFTDARLIESLERAREAHRARDYARAVSGGATESDDRWPSQIVVRSVGRNDIVPVGDVQWIEAVGYYARLHAASATLLHRESLDSLAARLDPAVFARVHRSSIVRIDAIRRTRRTRSGAHEVTLASGQRVAVSRAGWTSLRGRVSRVDSR